MSTKIYFFEKNKSAPALERGERGCEAGVLFSRLLKKDAFSAPVYYLSGIGAVAASVLAGWLLNAALTPLYFTVMGIPITAASVMAGVWGSTLLNAVKAAFNLLPFFPVYYALNKAFSKIYC